MRLVGDREAPVRLLPAAPAGGDAVAGEPALGVRRPGRVEVLVEVLLAGQHRAPGGVAPGAVVERPQHAAPAAVGAGAHPLRPGSRAVEREGRPGVDAAVAARAPLVDPGGAVVLAAHLDHGHPVGGHLDLRLLGGHRPVPVGEHHLGVRVLVVEDDHAAPPRPAAVAVLAQGQVVGVVAGLTLLGLDRLPVHVEGGSAGLHRVAPGDHGCPGEAGRHHEVVHVGGRGGDGREPPQPVVGVRQLRGGRGGVGGGGPGHAGQRCGPPGEDRSTTHRALDHVAEVGVVAGVGHRLGAGVAAAVAARRRAPAPRVGGEDRQQAAAGGGRGHGHGRSSVVGG